MCLKLKSVSYKQKLVHKLVYPLSLGLVHTDDRLALLEIVKQLDIKEDFGDKITVRYHLSDDNDSYIRLPVKKCHINAFILYAAFFLWTIGVPVASSTRRY